MKKLISFLVAFVVCFTLPILAIETKPIKVNVSIHGTFTTLQQGYSYDYGFPYLGETFRFSDEVKNAGSTFGFGGGIGIFVIPNVELFGGIDTFSSKSCLGTYGISVPHPLYYNMPATDKAEAKPTFKRTMISFGINFHPTLTGKAKPYFGAGMANISAKYQLMDDIHYVETLNLYTGAYSVEIDQVKFTETSLSKWGFNLQAGLNFEISSNIFFYTEGRYVIAKTQIDQPMIKKNLDEEEILNINLGGLQAVAGIKIFF
jgi:opacity protein-like surface antigen